MASKGLLPNKKYGCYHFITGYGLCVWGWIISVLGGASRLSLGATVNHCDHSYGLENGFVYSLHNDFHASLR